MLNYFDVTTENLDEAKDSCSACDQKKELSPGCETWEIMYGSQRGQMSRWNETGRGAVDFGGDSMWGDWMTVSNDAAPVAWLIGQQVLSLDNDSLWVTEEGECIDPQTGEAPDSI